MRAVIVAIGALGLSATLGYAVGHTFGQGVERPKITSSQILTKGAELPNNYWSMSPRYPKLVIGNPCNGGIKVGMTSVMLTINGVPTIIPVMDDGDYILYITNPGENCIVNLPFDIIGTFPNKPGIYVTDKE